jgi:hypothetical protein
MPKKIVTLLFCLKISLSALSQTDSIRYSPVQTKYYFDWGNNRASILLTQYGHRKDVVFIHLHDDEMTSATAAAKILERTGGLLIRIDNKGRRLMNFKKSGKWFLFDPNRIFTPRGIQKNLAFLNNHVTSAASSSVKAFAAFILRKIPKSVTTFIALHNNDDGQYSINSYKVNGNHARDASRIYVNKAKDPDNFFIVTKRRIFDQLKKENYNVVLQNSSRAKDDGSLSIYFGRRKLTYINVEAQKDTLEEQTEMLRQLMKILH